MTKSSIPYSRLEDDDIVHVSSSDNRLRRPVAVFFTVGIAVIIISIVAIVLLAAFLVILGDSPVSSIPSHKSSVPGTSVPSDHLDLLRLLHRLRSLEQEVASLRSQCQRRGSGLQESEANQQYLLNGKTNRHHQSTVSPSSDGNVIDDSKFAATNVKYTEIAPTTLPKALSTDTNDIKPLNPGLSLLSLSHRQVRSKGTRKASWHEQTDSHGESVRNPGDRDRDRSDQDRSDQDRSDQDRSGRDRTNRDRDLSERDRDLSEWDRDLSDRDLSDRDRSGQDRDSSNPDGSKKDCSDPDRSNRDEQQSGTRREETTRNRPSRHSPGRRSGRSCKHCIDNDKINAEGEQAEVSDTFQAPPTFGRAVHIQGKRNGNIRIPGDGWIRGFKWWEKADRTDDTDQGFDLDVFGTVTVTESGLYYVYSQVLFYDPNDTVGQSITINEEPYFTCTKSNISAEAKQSTCYVGGVVRINAGDTVGIKLSVRNITIAFHADTTYYGLFRVA